MKAVRSFGDSGQTSTEDCYRAAGNQQGGARSNEKSERGWKGDDEEEKRGNWRMRER